VGGLRLDPPARSERGITEAPFKELEIDEAFEGGQEEDRYQRRSSHRKGP
jgi:hypothetical protein